MAALRRNQFWKLGSKHDKNIIFATPDTLLQSAYEYFEWCDKHSWYKHEPIKSGSAVGTIIEVPVARPYSMSGLCSYLGCSQRYISEFGETCSDEFTEVIERIETIIEAQQFEGAVAGVFNATVVTRKIGLRDQPEIASNADTFLRIEVTDAKTKDELNKLREKLTSEKK